MSVSSMATLDTSDNPDDGPYVGKKGGYVVMVIGALIFVAGFFVHNEYGFFLMCLGLVMGVLGFTAAGSEDVSPEANDDNHDGEIRTHKFGKVTIKDKLKGDSWKQDSTEIWIEGKWGAVSFYLVAIFSAFLTFYQGWFHFIPGLSDLEGNMLLSFIASIISMILLSMMPRIFRIWLLINGITTHDDEE